MKKVVLFVILLTCFSIISSAYTATELGPVQIREGWNLLSGFHSPDQLESQVLDSDQIKAIYAFQPLEKKYYRMYPNQEELTWSKSEDILLNTGYWVYSESDAYTEYLFNEDDIISYEDRDIYQGWNFLGITPDMLGKSMNDILGSCDFEKVYHFESLIQEWSNNLVNDPFMDETLTNSARGLALAVKVSDDCQLGLTETTLAPPSIPLIDSCIMNAGAFNCLDSAVSSEQVQVMLQHSLASTLYDVDMSMPGCDDSETVSSISPYEQKTFTLDCDEITTPLDQQIVVHYRQETKGIKYSQTGRIVVNG